MNRGQLSRKVKAGGKALCASLCFNAQEGISDIAPNCLLIPYIPQHWCLCCCVDGSQPCTRELRHHLNQSWVSSEDGPPLSVLLLADFRGYYIRRIVFKTQPCAAPVRLIRALCPLNNRIPAVRRSTIVHEYPPC